jgi:ubiquinone/menaquinone biosynthesis C-methylase UbiE
VIRENIDTREHDAKGFESLYLELRAKEQRIYTDEQLRHLPFIPGSHIHAAEWKLRKKSAQRLTSYLENKKMPLNILEVGCGNGWLAAKLSTIKDSKITALDINRVELNQGTRVFSEFRNLQFEYGDVRNESDPRTKYDIIVFASSLQYFPSLDQVLDASFKLLKNSGEIHILDTAFYTEENLHAAQVRTENYFRGQGMPEMTAFYFHHLKSDLQKFKPRILYNPLRWLNRLKNNSPFYWICLSLQ